MIHALIPAAAFALVAAVLFLIDWLRVCEERRRRDRWRLRVPRRYRSRTSGDRHDAHYP
ncbi:MAG: hypothetical protein VKI63_04260 [Cyanobium sp.]|nr:hypothetical protein [Cyanobium sp.]